MADGRGIRSPRAGEIWNAYSSLSDRKPGESFLRTLRSVVDYRGQAVSALNRLQFRVGATRLAIWGDQDNIIPVDHASRRPGRPAGQSARSACRASDTSLKWKHPTRVVDIIEHFISTTGRHAEGDGTACHSRGRDDTPGVAQRLKFRRTTRLPVFGPLWDHTLCAMASDLRF